MLPRYLFLIFILLSGCSSSRLVIPEATPGIAPGMPEILTPGRLEYPIIAAKNGLEGVMYAEVYIDTSGTVRNVEIIKREFNYAGVYEGKSKRTIYVDEIFDEPLTRFWMETKFKPGIRNGKPVNYRVVIPMNFRLRK